MAYGDKVIDVTAEELENAVKGFGKKAYVLGVPGFYGADNVLIKTFDKMIADGDVTVADGALKDANITNIRKQGKLIISEDITELATGIFSNESLLIGAKIPDTVTTIPSGAFSNCTSLTSVIISDSVTSIGNAAFGSCKSLKSVTFGKGVTHISDGAFDNCNSLTDVYYKGSKTEFDKIEIGTSNENLKNATIHYEQIGSTAVDLTDYAKKEDVEGFGVQIDANQKSIESLKINKADKTYVDGELETKADKTALDAKADKTTADALGKRIDDLILSSAEVVDARTGYDGTAYDTLGTAIRSQVSELKGDIDKLDESVKKKIEPHKTTFFDYTEETHESSNLFNVQNTVVTSDGLTITIKDGNIKCEGVYSLSYNKSIDTGATISLQKGEYDVSAWNGSGEFDVDLVSESETKRVNCNGATHTFIKLAADTTYSIKVRCTPLFSSGSCDLMIVKGLSKPLAYEKWFETYSTFSDASVQKAVLPMYQKFYGKRIVTIGDSIMHGDGNDHYGIGDILAERNGMKLSDYSEGGATISFRQDKASASDEWSKGQNIQYQATKMLANETEKPCVVLIDGQTNDINYVSGSEEPQQALGTVTTSYTSFSSNETFCGGLEKIFSDIKKTWSDVPIIYIRVHKMMSRKVDWQESYGEKAIQICKKWSVKPVDIYTEGGLNTLISEHKIYTGNDGDYTHPNRQGYDIFYIPMIENAMMELLN